MLRNFQLAAIVKQSELVRLVRIPLHQALQQTLAASWQSQLDVFLNDVREIDFNAGYQPEENERFRLSGYDPPRWLASENSQSVANLEAIANNAELLNSIKGIVAFARNAEGREQVLFQNFSRSHIIQPGTFLFLKNDTYETAEQPGLTLSSKLAAAYVPADRRLVFHSFRNVNTFLPLADFYEDASEQQIREVLKHERLAAEDAEAVAVDANQWFRKRFAMLRDSEVLDQYSAAQIKARSRGYDVKIQISKGKIVFPAERAAARKLLQFLNEELFRGPITEALYETNSRRKAD